MALLLLACVSLRVQAGSPAADRSALVTFFKAADGKNWTDKEGWGTDAPIGSWYGVSVNSHCRVVKIELPMNNLTGTIPGELGSIDHLQTLDISFNYQLTGPIPKELGDITGLQTLLLNSNQLTGPIPKELGDITGLQTLLLNSNQLTGPIPKELGDITGLQTLSLNNNDLTGPIPKELGKITALQRLALNTNHLTGPIPKELGDITGLQTLLLNSNQLTGPIPKELGDITGLQTLSLNNNQLTGPIPKELGKITGLKAIALHINKLEGPIPKELGDITGLQTLSLNNNDLTGFPKEAAAGFERLRRLGVVIALDSNPWQDPPPAVVRRGFKAIIRYHEDIARSGSRKSWALKVVVVGAVCAGKSSVVGSLMAGEPRPVALDDRTRGVDVHVKTPFKPDASKSVQLVFWDFAGHDEYYSTHALFLSEGALFLLVVDLARFVSDISSRSDAILIWLDTLLCRTPGAVVQIVTTHIDELSGSSLDSAKRQLQQVVDDHLSAQCLKRGWVNSGRKAKMKEPPVLRIVDEILAVSCKEGPSCKEGTNFPQLGEALAALAMDGTMDLLSEPPHWAFQGAGWGEGKLFRDLGQEIPVVWARACAVMSALRDGTDPHTAACLGQPSPVVSKPIQQISLRGAQKKWEQVVGASYFRKEIGHGGTNRVLQDAIGMKEREGMFLFEHGLLYLDPTWIDKLMGAILDHRLQDPYTTMDWDQELQKFSNDNSGVVKFHELSNTHQTFRAAGTLTVSYLHFLWRDVEEIQEEGVFKCLLQTMCEHGVLFTALGGLSGCGDESQEKEEKGLFERLLEPLHGLLRQSGVPSPGGDDFGVGSLAALFVPVRLGAYPADDEGVKAFSASCSTHRWRRQLVFRIYQSYVPPGIIGMIMTRLLCSPEVEIHCTWGRGISFMIGGGGAILTLNPPPQEGGCAEIEVNLVGPEGSDELESKVKAARTIVEDSLTKHFPGLLFNLEGGKAHWLGGEDAWMDKMENLISHFDLGLNMMIKKLDLMGEKLDIIDERLVDVAGSVRESLMRVKKLQAENYPYPHLVVIREHQPRSQGRTRVLSKAWFKSIRTRVRGMAMKDMRLLFLCPYDTTEVPCGPQGGGYRFDQARDWVKKLLPVAQVTAVVVKVAFKAAAGIDLEVLSEYLNAFKKGIGGEVADRALNEETLRSVMLGDAAASADMETQSKTSYENLKAFLDEEAREQSQRKEANYVDFRNEMQQVDDGNSGLVWVSNANEQLWLDSVRTPPLPTTP